MNQQEILDRMRRLCSTREYCRRDILLKIESLIAKERKSAECSPNKGVGANSIKSPESISAEDIINTLCEEKFIDDKRYATFFAKDKSSLQGWGENKIKYALQNKGIEIDFIKFAIVQIDQDRSTEKLKKVIATKRDSLRGDPKAKEKLIRFLLSRGYTWQQFNDLI